MKALARAIHENGYSEIPSEVIDRDGCRVDTSGNLWRLNAASYSADIIDLSRYRHPALRYSVARFLIRCVRRSSASECLNTHSDIIANLDRVGLNERLPLDASLAQFKKSLSEAMFSVLDQLRAGNKLDRFYRISRWYLWCCDEIGECGFSPETALQLSRIRIPGNVKGESVRSQDPEEGPLSLELEEPLVRRALREDVSSVYEHIQQRLAVALCLAFGRNPFNYAQLREDDLNNLADGVPEMEDLWVLHIPRIKKRARPRSLFRAEPCAPELANMILELIRLNQERSRRVDVEHLPRPLFLRSEPLDFLLGTDSQEWALHLRSREVARLVRGWVRRLGLISPLTGEPLWLTPRRLRYTFACNMARQGASRAALAEMLDHTDTQHVGVYYELFDDLVPMLDKALAKKVGAVLKWFRGSLVDGPDEAVNGDDENKSMFFVVDRNPQDQTEIGVCGDSGLCALDPPYSCYLCPKFQPYRGADHDHVLELLIKDRESRLSRYESSRLGVQLDDVIYAVGQVITECEGAAR